MPLIFTKVISQPFPIVFYGSLRGAAEPVNREAVQPGPEVGEAVEALLADVAGDAAGRDLAVEALVTELAAPAHGVAAGQQAAFVKTDDGPGGHGNAE
ncbi:MAG: hypothetical protein KIS73_19585 [Enhydrobacter sp.]|nr:hypothetical protein [Enhydrobacter sp.]